MMFPPPDSTLAMQAPRRRWLLGMLALGTTGAARAQPAQAGRVVASFSVLADMAGEVAPAGVEVTSLVGPDADSHVFKPSPADGRRLAQADLVLVNGLGFEGWIERLVRASGYRGTVAVAAEGLKVRRGAGSRGHGHGNGHAHDVDPHAWHDLAHARHYVTRIAEALATRWPDSAAEIAGRRADYLARIDALDQRLRGRLAAVPREQRRAIVSHDAFGYLGAAYGIDFFAPQGWNTHSEPSAATVARLIRQIRQQQVRAIFVENISDPRLVERIAREAGARVGGTLYSDALSRPGGPADSYLKMFEHNVTTLAQALGT
jgi:zinc/manganese transport system substrate-binding protein